MNEAEKRKLVKDAIRCHTDFPKPGIIFRDIFSVFRDVTALKALKDLIIEHVQDLDIELVTAIDSRGFLFGPIICMELGKPFIPIRKKGKLPGKVVEKEYELEYEKATLEVQTGNIAPRTRALVVDDLLATGGSMGVAVNLLQSLGAEVVECLAIIELTYLKGRDKLTVPVHSIIQYS